MSEPTPGRGDHGGQDGAGRGRGRNRYYRGYRGGRRQHRGGGRVVSKTIFKGESKEMNGNVFQTHAERNKPGQFQDTLTALKLLASTEFKKDLIHLEPLFKKLQKPSIPLPVKPEAEDVINQKTGITETKVDEVKMDIYRERIKSYGTMEDRLNSTTKALYNIVWSQCSKLLRNKLKLGQNFEKIEDSGDVASLLRSIRAISYKIDPNQCIYDALDELQRQFFLYRQEGTDNALHLAKYKDYVEVLEHFGVNMFTDECCIEYEREVSKRKGEKELTSDAYIKKVRARRHAACFLRRANPVVYGPLLRELRDSYLHKIDIYPETLDEAYSLLQHHSSGKKKLVRNDQGNGNDEIVEGIQHIQRTNNNSNRRGEPVPGMDGRCNPRTRCYACNSFGHFADNCPVRGEGKEEENSDNEDRVRGTQNHIDGAIIDENSDEDEDDDDMVIGFTHASRTDGENIIDSENILLDTGSNCSVFNNKQFLTNIRKSSKVLRAFTNGGYQDSGEVGYLENFFDVWYNPSSMMNILSFSEVAAKYRVTMDSAYRNEICVHLDGGKSWKFSRVKSGLYLLNKNNYSNDELINYSYLNLANDNEMHFNNRDTKNAQLAMKLYEHCNCPGYDRFISMIRNNYFRNLPITTQDAKRALYIYGKNIAEMKGKGIRKRPMSIQDIQTIDLPSEIKNIYDNIQVSVDYVFIQGIPMLHSISGKSYQFRTLQPVYKSRADKSDILNGIKAIINIYQARGIKINQINGDNEFGCVKDAFIPTRLNIVAAEEHVGDVERSIRTLKDGIRTHISRLPYTHYPRAMVAGAAMHTLISINQLPTTNGVSTHLSPGSLITGEPTPDYQQLIKLNFGDIVLTADGKTRSDPTTSRKIEAVALYPSKNASGGWYMMSINTGYVLHRYSWDIVVATEDMIKRVNELGKRQNQSKVEENFTYESRSGIPYFEPNIDDENVTNISEEEENISDRQEEHTNTDEDHADVVEEAVVEPPTRINEGADEDAEEIEEMVLNDVMINDGVERGEANFDDVARSEILPDEIRSGDTAGDQRESNNISKENSNTRRLSTPGNHDIDDTPVRENMEKEIDNVDMEEEEIDVIGEILENDAMSGHINTTSESEEKNGENEIEELTSDSNQRDVDHREPDNSEQTTVKERSDNDVPRERNPRGRARIDYRDMHRRGRGTQLAQIHKKVKRILRKKYKVKISDTFRRIVGIIMANVQTASDYEQMSMKKGIKKFGEDAIQAVLAEYAQLDNKEVFEGVDPDSLSFEQKKEALELITLIKLKRCGKVKGRACANGKKQRRYIKKETISSPTVQLESLILTLVVAAFEERDVATADVPGAYLCAKMTDFVLVKLRDQSVEILCSCNKNYEKYVRMEKGKKVLYLRLAKALYGCLQSALLWYETFVGCLQDLGFEINPYDPCVANKIIDGKQCTVSWYVDDTMISHQDPKVVSWIIEKIEQRFGKMSVTRGKEHVFVGMDFKMREDNKVEITMKDYIKECITGYEKVNGEITGKGNTPGKHDLFAVDEEATELDEDRKDLFHHIVSKLLYVSKRARLDIDLVISFLCTRVSKSTEEDWTKLGRLLKYLKGTIDMPRIVGADRLDAIKTWVDASYGTHSDMRGHTGGVISVGPGVINSKSTKQKLNTKSSTETEIVGASDFLPWSVWTKRFMEAQGHTIKSNIYYQDNESAIRIEKNGRQSCGEKSRHIGIRYFFIKDITKRENISIEHCRTDIMLADYFTKPLQGKLFRKMRDAIMGLSNKPHEERVEGNNKTCNGPSIPSTVKPVKYVGTYADVVRNRGKRVSFSDMKDGGRL